MQIAAVVFQKYTNSDFLSDAGENPTPYFYLDPWMIGENDYAIVATPAWNQDVNEEEVVMSKKPRNTKLQIGVVRVIKVFATDSVEGRKATDIVTNFILAPIGYDENIVKSVASSMKEFKKATHKDRIIHNIYNKLGIKIEEQEVTVKLTPPTPTAPVESVKEDYSERNTSHRGIRPAPDIGQKLPNEWDEEIKF